VQSNGPGSSLSSITPLRDVHWLKPADVFTRPCAPLQVQQNPNNATAKTHKLASVAFADIFAHALRPLSACPETYVGGVPVETLQPSKAMALKARPRRRQAFSSFLTIIAANDATACAVAGVPSIIANRSSTAPVTTLIY
jgi:hypothetical protein